MKIYVSDSGGDNMKYLGNTKDACPVPRIGEKVFVGYSPSPNVTSVGYDYDQDMVIVVVDGFVYK